jgi:SAM-dependent methyltransferase
MMMLLLLHYWRNLHLALATLLFVAPIGVPAVLSGFVATSRRLPFDLFNIRHRKYKQHISSSTGTITEATDSMRCWAKSKKSSRGGGGGGGFGAKTVSASSSKLITAASLQKTMLKKVQQKYGGTSAQEIAQSTQQQIEAAIKQLPPHMQMAIQFYQQLQKWNAHVAGLSVLEQATHLSTPELDGAKRAQDELNRLYQQYDISSHNVHNILQQITWNASADAKAARSVTGNMPTEIETRVDRACVIVAKTLRRTAAASATQSSNEAVEKATQSSNEAVETATAAEKEAAEARMLDVGCGFGVLVPHLIKAGVQPSQIFGVDLSPEMIRNAQEMHQNHDRHRSKNAGPTFEAVDFLGDDYRGPPPKASSRSESDNHAPDTGGCCFDSIIFCSSLHDMPDVIGAINKAARLLRPDGTLVIVHPQGASHVLNQVRANPALVTRGLPEAEELQTLCSNTNNDAQCDTGLELVVEPASAGSKEEALEGYLAVLQKRRRIP